MSTISGGGGRAHQERIFAKEMLGLTKQAVLEDWHSTETTERITVQMFHQCWFPSL